MPGIIARQPNGLLCRWSTVTDSFTHYNMTDEQYVEYCVEQAREQALWELKECPRFPRPFEEVIQQRDFLDACLNEIIERGYCPDDYDSEQDYNDEIDQRRKSLAEADEIIDKMSKPLSIKN